MLPNLTPAAERALASATRWASHAGVAQVEASHLLLALIEEEEGRVAELLRRQGVELEPLRELLAPGLARCKRAATGPEQAVAQPHDPALDSIAYSARTWALELVGETTVASEHLLVAVLSDNPNLAGRLQSIGLHQDRLIESMRGKPGPALTLDEPLDLTLPSDAVSTARILDANANRAREALRVIEEFCRFHLDDAFLTGQLKSLRHELAEILADVPLDLLLASRDTQGDVGTSLTTPSEGVRHTPRDVVQANLKRLQEGLRVLEEYGKTHGSALGQAFERLRYRTYTLEKAILTGAFARERLADVRLYVLLSGDQCTAAIDWTIQEAAAGGAQMFQLREKDLDDRALLARARQVRRWTRKAGSLFILNDHPDLAVLAEADGVHVGQEDLPVHEVRRIVGPHLLIGVSTHNLEQLRQAMLDGASYAGVGPTFPSATKEFAELAGREFVRQAAAETTVPSVAIGGIGLENVDQVVAAGIKRVAVSTAICTADEPRLAAAALRQALDVPQS
jgi:thiamine-phosphate pyrophosphorylase